jgi:transposase
MANSYVCHLESDFTPRRESPYESKVAELGITGTDSTSNQGHLLGQRQVGQRINAKVPYGHWRTMTFIAALRHDRIDAPFVFDQPINGESMVAWVEQVLCPTLQARDVVVMDNLSSHKRPEIRRAIRQTGATLIFLPPYSPDLNPIEQMFAKLKHLLRKAAERTHEATWRKIGTLLNTFTPNECANYLANAGYASV